MTIEQLIEKYGDDPFIMATLIHLESCVDDPDADIDDVNEAFDTLNDLLKAKWLEEREA